MDNAKSKFKMMTKFGQCLEKGLPNHSKLDLCHNFGYQKELLKGLNDKVEMMSEPA